MIGIVDHVEVVGEFMGREHPANQIDIDGIIFDNENPERQSWGSSHERAFLTFTRGMRALSAWSSILITTIRLKARILSL